LAFDGGRSTSRIQRREIDCILQSFRYLYVVLHNTKRRKRARPRRVILVQKLELLQMHLHRRGHHQREPRVHAVGGELARERAQEQPPERATEARAGWLALAVSEAPCGHIEGREVGGIESVASGEGDGVAKDRTTDRVT
jgi:hypothetical protein